MPPQPGPTHRDSFTKSALVRINSKDFALPSPFQWVWYLKRAVFFNAAVETPTGRFWSYEWSLLWLTHQQDNNNRYLLSYIHTNYSWTPKSLISFTWFNILILPLFKLSLFFVHQLDTVTRSLWSSKQFSSRLIGRKILISSANININMPLN